MPSIHGSLPASLFVDIEGIGPSFLDALQHLINAHLEDVHRNEELDPAVCPQKDKSPTKEGFVQISDEEHGADASVGVDRLTLMNPFTEEQRQLIDVFHAMDQDGSGSLNTDEMRRALKFVGLPNARVVKMLRMADRDRSGEIELHEWISVISNTDVGGFAEFLQFSDSLEDIIPKLKSMERVVADNRVRYVISPFSPFRLVWNLAVMISCIFIALEFPFMVAWEQTIPEHIVNALMIPEFAIDVILIIDIFLNFFTGFVDDRGTVILEHRAIAVHYLRSWFVLDLVSSLPLDGFTSGSFINVQMLKVLKFWKVLRLFKIMKIGKYELADVSGLLADFSLSKVAYTLRRRSNMLLYMVLVSHWMSCGMKFVDEGFLVDFENIGGDVWREYLVAWYWAMMTLTTTGYGDITPVTDGEIGYVIFAMVIGGSFYGYVVGTIASMVSRSDLNQTAYYERMEVVHAWLSHHQLPAQLKRRLRRYFKSLMEQQSAANEADLWQDLTQELQMDVGKYVVHDTVKSNPLFDNIGIGAIVQLQSVLKRVIMEPRQRVTTSGEVGTAMYMIVNGLLELSRLSRLCSMGPGESFGEEILLGFREDYDYTVEVLERSSLEIIEERDFLMVFQCMPKIVDRMRRNALALNPDWASCRTSRASSRPSGQSLAPFHSHGELRPTHRGVETDIKMQTGGRFR